MYPTFEVDRNGCATKCGIRIGHFETPMIKVNTTETKQKRFRK